MKNVVIHNIKPSYVTASEVLSEEVAQTLIDLVDEQGKRTTWAYNPGCIETQIANPFSRERRSNDPEIVKILPDLFGLGEDCMRQMNNLFTNNVCDIITGHHGFWVIKYGINGEFSGHCDWDSGPDGIRPPVVATACMMLNDNFSGGETIISNPCGKDIMLNREKYSALLWDGFTQHKIAPITEGNRYVLVIHYTGTIK